MINIEFSISNPFSERFGHILLRHGSITRNKSWEFNIYRGTNIFTMLLRYTARQDHAGLKLQFGLFGYECDLYLYDTRHWDYKENRWHR